MPAAIPSRRSLSAVLAGNLTTFFRVEGCMEAMFKLHLIYIYTYNISLCLFQPLDFAALCRAAVFFLQCVLLWGYDTTEKKLKREFEVFGSIKKAIDVAMSCRVNPEQFEADFIEMKEKFNFSYENEVLQFWCLEFQEVRF